MRPLRQRRLVSPAVRLTCLLRSVCSYQLAPQPPSLVCDAQSFQPANGVNASIPGQIVNPNDPTGTTFWCQVPPWLKSSNRASRYPLDPRHS